LFRPDDGVLVVTEKNTNKIDTFLLDDGVAQPAVSFPSSGTELFGFAFGPDDIAIISDAAGGPGGTAALSSYEVEDKGDLTLVTPASGDTQQAACWVVVPKDGRFAFTTNTSSNTISSYTISEDGQLALFDVTAASTGTGTIPIDMALSRDSRFLYVRDGGSGTVMGFHLGEDGKLTLVTTTSGVPAGAQGIAAN
jgi:6-phosphogluconolactonase